MNSASPAHDPDAALAPTLRETLRAVLGLLVPASPDGRMPGAAEMPELLRHVASAAAALPAVRDGLAALEHEAAARHGAAFAALEPGSRLALLHEFAARQPAVLQRLALEAVTCYYQQDGVVERLGLEARAPYPLGYPVVSGDLTLLGPVVARGRIYRDPS